MEGRKIFNKLITENDVEDSYDIRRNHGCFGVHDELNNFFQKYSSMKQQGKDLKENHLGNTP